MDVLLLRYGELFLKGGNRPQFERQLGRNIEAMTGRKVNSTRGRLLMEYFEGHQQLQRIFGLTSYSPAWKVEKNPEKLKTAALKMAQQFRGTFKVETTRSDKTFPLTSLQMNTLLGKYIEQETTLQADYKNPQHTLFLELNQAGAFLYTEIIPGVGGLPVGSSGTVHLLLEDEAVDARASILAGLLMMKRGCRVVPVGKKMDISLLQQFSPIALKSMPELPEGENIVITGKTFSSRQGSTPSQLAFHPLIAYSLPQIQKQLQLFNSLSTLNTRKALPALSSL